MVTVGVFVRARRGELVAVTGRLRALEGVATLSLEEPGTLGVLIQAPDVDAAHAKLVDEVRATEGVLVAWPVHSELGAPTREPAAWHDASIPVR